jgi:hypothetical protein
VGGSAEWDEDKRCEEQTQVMHAVREELKGAGFSGPSLFHHAGGHDEGSGYCMAFVQGFKREKTGICGEGLLIGDGLMRVFWGGEKFFWGVESLVHRLEACATLVLLSWGVL